MMGDWEGAKSIISSMSAKGLTPDTETYRELLKGYAKFGICFAISSSLENWKKMNISFSDGDLLAALYKAAVHGHSEAVDILLNRMRKDRDYNRSCVNIILQLVTQRKENEAFKILLSMKPKRTIDGKVPGSGRFFIRHIVKTNCSSDKIVEFCRKLVQTEKNSRAFFIALEAANIFERIELVDPLLNEIRDGGSFANSLGAILASGMLSGGEKKLIDTLRKMAAIRLYPNVQTINKHILPHLAGDSQTLLQKLRSARLSFPVISVALLQKSLASLDFNEAIRITSTFYISMNLRLYEDIATAYVKSQNATGLARLMNSLLPDGEEDETKNEAMELSSQIIGSVLKEICDQTPSGQLEVIEPLLKALKDQGLTISLSVAQFVRDKASEGKMTSAAVDLLAELTSGKLIPVPLNPTPRRLQLATISQVEKNIAKFRTFARERKLDEALAVRKELDAHNVPFSDGLNLLLIDLYGHHGRLDEALDVFSRMHMNPDLIVLPSKIMILSARLLKVGRIDDAIRVLEKLKIDPRVTENIELTRLVNASAIRLMDAAAENGNVETIQKIFDCLEQSKALKMSRALLGSLVKVHVVRDDLDSALDEFDRWTKERRTTPWNTQLAANLIEKDDTTRLDRLMRMNTAVHGEKNSLFDLSLAFLSCQRVRDAKNVLETPGLRIVNSRLDNVCAFYVRRKKIDELENLVKITKNVFNVDRHMLYNHLLAACIKVDDPKRATNVWTLMQEEGDLVPDSGFLRRLGDFLTTKKMLVPFSVPPSDQMSS
ncbi:leucine-rich PPR motif-containing protein, mitochondrial-like isoform X2 [Daphnia pulicaria]|nr:leucine-rich PPR motif-containing protein, mitochondrial-like isoform X2 [Daphnia pulicaria]